MGRKKDKKTAGIENPSLQQRPSPEVSAKPAAPQLQGQAQAFNSPKLSRPAVPVPAKPAAPQTIDNKQTAPADTRPVLSTFDRITKARGLDSKPKIDTGESRIPKPGDLPSRQEIANARPVERKDGTIYKGNTDKLYDAQGREVSSFRYILGLNDQNQMSPEEKKNEEKREKREKLFSAIGDGLSALANVYFTSKGSPNMYEPKTSMSAKTKEYWDKLNAERKADADKYNALLIDAYAGREKEKTEERHYQDLLRAKKEELEEKRRERQEKFNNDASKTRYAMEKDKADRESREKIAREQIAASEKRANADRYQRQQQFEIRYGKDGKGGSNNSKKYTFSMGRGKGSVSVNADKVNDANVRQIYDKLPEDVRKRANDHFNKRIINKMTGQPEYTKDENGNKVPVYEPLTKDEMLEIIGSEIENNPDLADDIRDLAGEKTGTSEKEDDFSQYKEEGGSKKDYSQYKKKK